MREAGEHDVIEFIELGFQRGDNRRMTMTKDVGPPRTDRIEIALAVEIFEPDTLCRLDRDQRQCGFRPRVIAHLRARLHDMCQRTLLPEIGRASCRERVWKSV